MCLISRRAGDPVPREKDQIWIQGPGARRRVLRGEWALENRDLNPKEDNGGSGMEGVRLTTGEVCLSGILGGMV